jgi:hypothetical protein
MKIRKTYILRTIYDFINENISLKTKVAYHVTRRENLPSIFEKGLEPRIPTDYGPDGDIKGVYLFKTLDDTKNALYNWLGERIEEWEEENDQEYNEVVLEMNIDGLENHLLDTVEYEWTCMVIIEPERIVNVFEM